LFSGGGGGKLRKGKKGRPSVQISRTLGLSSGGKQEEEVKWGGVNSDDRKKKKKKKKKKKNDKSTISRWGAEGVVQKQSRVGCRR